MWYYSSQRSVSVVSDVFRVADHEDIDLVAGADIAPESRERFETEFDRPAYEDYRALLAEHADELDAVNVATLSTLLRSRCTGNR